MAAAGVVATAYDRGLITESWLQVIPVAGAGLAYGIAAALGGSGFIAAFVAGAIFGVLASRESEQASRLSEEVGALLGGVTLLVFGAILLGPVLEHVTWQVGDRDLGGDVVEVVGRGLPAGTENDDDVVLLDAGGGGEGIGGELGGLVRIGGHGRSLTGDAGRRPGAAYDRRTGTDGVR